MLGAHVVDQKETIVVHVAAVHPVPVRVFPAVPGMTGRNWTPQEIPGLGEHLDANHIVF